MKLGNMKLQLDCLLNMSKMSKVAQDEDEETRGQERQTWTIFERAYDVIFSLSEIILTPTKCAKGLGENQTANLCLCNMGVIEGSKKFDEFTKNFDFGGSQ